MSMMLPKTAKAYLKEHKFRSDLVMGFGLMKTTYIADYDRRIASILLDLPSGKKYVYHSNEKEADNQSKLEPILEFQKTDEVKNIAGYSCNKLIVTNKKTKETYPVYYTEKIGLEEMNWNTPYEDIEGFLMDYPITRNNMEMKLTVNEIIKTEVSDSLFVIPGEYKPISKKDFDRLIKSLMNFENM